MKLFKQVIGSKSMELYEIAPGLFMSGSLAKSMDYLERGVSAVINLKEIPDSYLPKKLHWGLYVHWPIEDGPMPDAPMVRRLAKFIVGLVEDGRKVLVHCHGGNNRSGLVVARTLIEQGMSAEEAIERVRQGRGPTALSNQQFVEWLLQEKAEQASSVSVPR